MISDPNIALLLMIAGALGICAEFCAPGLIVPGVAGSVLALLGFASLVTFPIYWPAAALMAFSFVLLFAGAKFASRGILTGMPALTAALASARLIDTAGSGPHISPATASAVFVFALIMSFVVAVAARARRNKDILKS
jgi:membrane-bound serine protease (ClpP class)